MNNYDKGWICKFCGELKGGGGKLLGNDHSKCGEELTRINPPSPPRSKKVSAKQADKFAKWINSHGN